MEWKSEAILNSAGCENLMRQFEEGEAIFLSLFCHMCCCCCCCWNSHILMFLFNILCFSYWWAPGCSWSSSLSRSSSSSTLPSLCRRPKEGTLKKSRHNSGSKAKVTQPIRSQDLQNPWDLICRKFFSQSEIRDSRISDWSIANDCCTGQRVLF